MLWIEKWLYLQKYAGKLEKTFQIKNMVVAEVSALCTCD